MISLEEPPNGGFSILRVDPERDVQFVRSLCIDGRSIYTVSQFVMARSRHTAHRAKRIVSRAFTTSKSSPALGLS